MAGFLFGPPLQSGSPSWRTASSYRSLLAALLLALAAPIHAKLYGIISQDGDFEDSVHIIDPEDGELIEELMLSYPSGFIAYGGNGLAVSPSGELYAIIEEWNSGSPETFENGRYLDKGVRALFNADKGVRALFDKGVRALFCDKGIKGSEPFSMQRTGVHGTEAWLRKA